jgi:hypothetical protein
MNIEAAGFQFEGQTMYLPHITTALRSIALSIPNQESCRSLCLRAIASTLCTISPGFVWSRYPTARNAQHEHRDRRLSFGPDDVPRARDHDGHSIALTATLPSLLPPVRPWTNILPPRRAEGDWSLLLSAL